MSLRREVGFPKAEMRWSGGIQVENQCDYTPEGGKMRCHGRDYLILKFVNSRRSTGLIILKDVYSCFFCILIFNLSDFKYSYESP